MGMNQKAPDADAYAKWSTVKTGPEYLTNVLNDLSSKIVILKANPVYVADSSAFDRAYVAAFETWITNCISSKPTPP